MEAVLRKVSILIPTFKPGSYLIDCLESIENQTLDKGLFKVYIGLNGLRQPYYQFIQDILNNVGFDCELIYIEPAGVSNARNVLIERSTEDFIVFIDDDDVVSPSYLDELLEVSSRNAMGVANVYNFQSTPDERRVNYIGKTFQTIADGESSKFKTRKYFSSPWAKMLHREMIGSHSFDFRVTKGEDSLFMALISPNVKSVKKTSDDACYFVHERLGSVTRRKKSLHDEIRILNYLMLQYLRLLFSPRYDPLFVVTRLVATTFKYFKLIKA